MYNDFNIIYSRFYNSEKIVRSFHQDASLAKMFFFFKINICFNYKKRERERETIYIFEYSTNKRILIKNEFSLSAKICRIYYIL